MEGQFDTHEKLMPDWKNSKKKRKGSPNSNRQVAKSNQKAAVRERQMMALEAKVPITKKRVEAVKITDTLLRATKRPKSAHLFGRKSSGSNENSGATGNNRTNRKSEYSPSSKYGNNRHVNQGDSSAYRVRARPNSGGPAKKKMSSKSSRPSSAPHKRSAAKSPENVISKYILQERNPQLKLTPLERRERGWSARSADLQGGIPVYDASVDRYCPLYSPERHVIPGLNPRTSENGPSKGRREIKQVRRRAGVRSKKASKKVAKGLRREVPERAVQNSAEIRDDRSEDKQYSKQKQPYDAIDLTDSVLEQARDALEPPRITFSKSGTDPSKEVKVVKAILRREQALQMLRKSSGRAQFNPQRISSLMERYREATIDTVEAVVDWSEANSEPFMWHGKNYLLSVPADLDALWHSKNIRSFLHFDIRRNPFLVPLEANKSKNSDQLPENISYYPGAEVNIKMDRLLKAEQNILQEEERFFGGQHNGPLLPIHWNDAKTADYLMLRSAVFKDIELDIQNGNDDFSEETEQIDLESAKHSPIQVPVAKSQLVDEAKDATENAQKERDQNRWKTVFVDVGEERIPVKNTNESQNELVLQTEDNLQSIMSSITSKTPGFSLSINIDESLARSKDMINAKQKTSTPTQTTHRGFKTISPRPYKSLTSGTISPLSMSNVSTNTPVAKPENSENWDKVRQRSPITRKSTTWEEHFDPESQCNWYYNTVTAESTWEKPADWKDEGWDEIKQRSPVTQISGNWQECFDPTYNCNWYYNKESGESTWVKPATWNGGKRSNSGTSPDGKTTISIGQRSPVQMPVLDLTKTFEKSTLENANDLPRSSINVLAVSPGSTYSGNKVLLDRENRRIEEHFRKLRRTHYETLETFDGSQWVEIFDPQNEAMYYWNQSSGKVQWEKPEKFILAKDDIFIHSALKIQNAIRAKKARKKVRQKRGERNVNADYGSKGSIEWIKAFDPSSNLYYYYNRTNNEVSWHKPKEAIVFNSPKLDLNDLAATNTSVAASPSGNFLSDVCSPIPKLEETYDDQYKFNGGMSPEERKLLDDVSQLKHQLEVAERELDFARFGFSYANETRSQVSQNWDFSVDANPPPRGMNTTPKSFASSPKAQSILSSSFAMVHDLCADATHHAHALDVKFGHVLKVAEEERQAGMKIQAFWRSILRKQNYGAKVKQESVLKIQKSWRGKQGRSSFNEHKKRVEEEKREKQRREHAANRINSRVRGYHARKRVNGLKQEREHAALRIQKHARRHKAKREVQKIRSENEERKAAVQIQSHVRKARAKKHYLRKKKHCSNAAQAIQSKWRGQKTRQEFRDKRDAAVKLQSHARMRIQKKELQKKKETRRVQDEKSSAIKLQSRYRGYRARRKVKEKVKHLEANEAATIIQSIWRGYITRETYMYVCQIRGERATMIQSAWRSYACRRNLKRSKEELEEIRQEKLAQKSSVLIQSSWRGYVAKLVYNEIKHIRGWGASIIQTWWRRTIANYKFRHAVSSTIKIQHWFRDMLKQKEQAYLDNMMFEIIQNEAAAKIQSYARGAAARREVAYKFTMKMEERQMREVAATRVQAHYRGFQGRRKVEDMSFAHIYGATRIQSVYRGHLARRFAWVFKTAAIRIQSWWRGVMPSGPRSKYLQRRVVPSSLLVSEQLFSIEKAGGGRAMDIHGNTSLLLAVHAGSLRLVQTCLAWGFDPNRANNFGETPLHVAAATGREEIAEMLVYANADVAAVDSVDRSVIHNAAEFGSYHIVKALVDRGALMDVQDSDGMTPMHLSSAHGHLECVSFMVICGADLHIQDNRGETCLHKAATIGATNVIHILAEHDGEMNSVNAQNHSPLHFAAKYGHADCVKMLLGFASNPNLQDKKGDTPAHFAARGGFQNCLSHLIEYEANLYVKNIADRTALQEAHLQGHNDVLEFITGKLATKEGMKANQSRYVPPEQFWQSPIKGRSESADSPVVLSLEDRVKQLSLEELVSIIDGEGVSRDGIEEISELQTLAINVLQKPVVQEKGSNYVVVTVPPGCFSGHTIAITVQGLGVAHVRVPEGCEPGDRFQFHVPSLEENHGGEEEEDDESSSTSDSEDSSRDDDDSSNVSPNNDMDAEGGSVQESVEGSDEFLL
eukprot:g2851.t1